MQRACQVTVAGIGVLASSTAGAHPEDYIDETFVYETIEQGELELELLGDLQVGRDDSVREVYGGAVELGLTERWMIDGAIQGFVDRGEIGFERFRTETRYRFAEEHAWLLDLAVSLEYEIERESPAAELEHIVTPRLVVSKDVLAGFNSTLNVDVPVVISEALSASFAYGLGVRYPERGSLRLGAELRHQLASGALVAFPQV